MGNEKFELTQEGVDKLKAELHKLVEVDRKKLLEDLAEARAQGDLSENADYDAARNKQGEMEARIKEIQNILNNSVIISEKKGNKGIVSLGVTVKIRDLSDQSVVSYRLVNTIEANPVKGLISTSSPLGKAIVGKRVGDVCLVKARVEYKVEILAIE